MPSDHLKAVVLTELAKTPAERKANPPSLAGIDEYLRNHPLTPYLPRAPWPDDEGA